MNLSWKEYHLNKNHQREREHQAEQARLAQLAIQRQQRKNGLKRNQLFAVVQSLTLRIR
jgi:hypothetical protein